MGKRTSDFMALAAILGGAGLGLGLTSLLYVESRVDRVPQADDSSVVVHVVPGRVPVQGSYPVPVLSTSGGKIGRDVAGRLRHDSGSYEDGTGASFGRHSRRDRLR